MKELLFVFAGGGLGSIARFGMNRLWGRFELNFPFATLSSNVLSCMLFGIVLGIASFRISLDEQVKLFLLTGFCGGFSTYSAFTFETLEFMKTGNSMLALGNIAANFLLCTMAIIAGMWLVKLISG